MIQVEAAPTAQGFDCDVEVREGERASRHNVRVDMADLERWARPGETPEQLVERSFEFLLAREPLDAILKSFALHDIPRYFPDFDQAIR